MSTILHAGWIKPLTILFATESPTNEKAFAFALAAARDFRAKLIIFHAYDTLAVAASEASGVRYYDYAGAARAEEELLHPLLKRAGDVGAQAEIVVRPGLAAQQILSYVTDHQIDRIIMGTRAPGPLGKLFVGSVAEEVVRGSHLPVMTVGPEAVDGSFHAYKIRRILCAVSLNSSCRQIVDLATRLAIEHGAHLTLLHVMPTRQEMKLEPGRSIETIDAELSALVPPEVKEKVAVEFISAVGDPVEEILYQSNLRQIDLLVFGAQEASQLSTITKQGLVNKVLAQSLCPVLTLTAVAPEKGKRPSTEVVDPEVYMAGIF